MSDYVELTNDEVMEFIDEKFTNGACGFCNTKKWLIETKLDCGALGISFISKEDILELYNKKFNFSLFDNKYSQCLFIAIICSNCGHSELFIRNFIVEWKLAKQEKKDVVL